jgi:hypothetical protein
MTELMLNKPENIHVKGGQRLVMVDSDVYNIAERLKEIDPHLKLVLHEGHEKPWVVVERGLNGVEYFVSRYEELGSHILEHLRYMRAVPLKDRVEKLAREADAANEKMGRWDEEKMDKFAHDFLKAAVESNMIDPKWTRNYALKKRG